jgi:hypothetical protein
MRRWGALAERKHGSGTKHKSENDHEGRGALRTSVFLPHLLGTSKTGCTKGAIADASSAASSYSCWLLGKDARGEEDCLPTDCSQADSCEFSFREGVAVKLSCETELLYLIVREVAVSLHAAHFCMFHGSTLPGKLCVCFVGLARRARGMLVVDVQS